MEHSAAVKSKLGKYQVRFVAFFYAAMGIALSFPTLMLYRLWVGSFDLADPGTYYFLAPLIVLAGAFIVPAGFLLRGSPWARYVLTAIAVMSLAIAVMSLGGWIYVFPPPAMNYNITLMLPNAVCAYLLIFSESFRKELGRRSGRTLVWKNFPGFVTAIVFFAVIFVGIVTYRSWQWKNDFSSEFALLEECYAAEIQLMEKIQAEMPDQLHSFDNNYEFRSEWIDSYSSVVQSMRFRDLYIWLYGGPPNSAHQFATASHDFFPEYGVDGGGIPLLVSEDENIMIERRGVDTEEPRYSLFFEHRTSLPFYKVRADFDTPDIENCGGKTSIGSSE